MVNTTAHWPAFVVARGRLHFILVAHKIDAEEVSLRSRSQAHGIISELNPVTNEENVFATNVEMNIKASPKTPIRSRALSQSSQCELRDGGTPLARLRAKTRWNPLKNFVMREYHDP